MGAWKGDTVCVLIGQCPQLMEGAIGSLPSESLCGFILVGPSSLRCLAVHRRCRDHWEVDLVSANLSEVSRLLSNVIPRTIALAVDEIAADFLSELPKGAWRAVPAAPRNVSKELRDKWSFFHFCRRLGIPTPETKFFASKYSVDFDGLTNVLGSPLVFKPTNARASDGVRVIFSRDEFEQEILFNRHYQYAPLLAQKYVPGDDCGVSLFAHDGRILHCAIQTPTDTEIRFFDNSHFREMATRLVSETSYSGFMNIDGRLQPDGSVVLLEVNARTWATMRSATWGGLNFIRAAIDFTRGNCSDQARLMPPGAAPRLASGMLRTLVANHLRLKGCTGDQTQLIMTLLVFRGAQLKGTLFK